MSNEIMRVLKMVEEGKISSEAGAKLIESIKNKEENAVVNIPQEVNIEEKKFELVQPENSIRFPNERMLRIFVDSSDGDKVKVNLPIRIVKSMIKATGKIPNVNINNMEGVNGEEVMDSISAAIDGDMVGQIVDIESSDGDIVKIVIE